MGESLVSGLTDLRKEVVDALTAAGLRAQHYHSEVITPPVCVVLPGGSYVTAANTFGAKEVALRVLVVSGKGTNQATADALDEAIESAVLALSAWDINSVAEPGLISLSGSTYLATVIDITTQITFTEGAG